jgi:hypothetical protein
MLITEIWSKQQGKWFCLASLTKTRSGEKPKVYWFKRHQFPTVGDKVDALNALKLNVYFCPHGFKEKRRTKQNAEPGYVLYADLDETAPSACKVEPTWVIESSPKRYVGLWQTDEIADEKVNQLWTYANNADRGGWDYGQLLRVPGTRNGKYPARPLVRSRGGSGTVYRLRDLRKLMPAKKTQELSEGDVASSTYATYEKKLKATTRSLLLAQKVNGEDRSKTLWRLNKDLIEAGVPTGAAFKILRATVWNKFRDRDGGDVQLKKELSKSVGEKLRSPVADIPQLFPKSMAEVELEKIDWIWYPYLARRELTILEGDPGVGKSWLIQMVGRHLADGDLLPGPKPIKHKPMTVVFFDFENTMGTVMKARLATNGMRRFGNFFQDDSMVDMMSEESLTAVHERLAELKPDLVVFDTLANYLGGTDGRDAISVSSALQQFRGIASKYNCPVCVLRHLNKGNSQEKAIYRGNGSIAFSGTARVCISVGYSPDDPDERLFAVNKINVAKVPPTRSYRITSAKEGDVGIFEWGDERLDMTADDIVKVARTVKSSDMGCADWLAEFLKDEGDQDKVMRAADGKGFMEKDVRRASKQLGVVVKGVGFGKKKRSIWTLPD